MCKKANNSLAFLWRNLQISQKYIKAKTYATLIGPQLDYVAADWNPWTGTKIDTIEGVQWRAARYVFRDYNRYWNPTAMMQQLGWHSLEQRRADNRLAFLFMCIHGLVAIDLSSDLVPQSRELRHGHSMSHITITDARNYINYSFLPRTIDQWNCLPEHIATSTCLDTFTKRCLWSSSCIIPYLQLITESVIPYYCFYFTFLHNSHMHLLSSFLSIAIFSVPICTFTPTARTRTLNE